MLNGATKMISSKAAKNLMNAAHEAAFEFTIELQAAERDFAAHASETHLNALLSARKHFDSAMTLYRDVQKLVARS